MGVYDTRALPIYDYLHRRGHPRYAIADNFFQAAFGGLVPQPPVADRRQQRRSGRTRSTTVGPTTCTRWWTPNGMPNNYPLYVSPLGTARQGLRPDRLLRPAGRAGRRPRRGCSAATTRSTRSSPPTSRSRPGTAVARGGCRRRRTPTIGDRLSGAGVDWAWYSGGWSNANGDIGAPGWTNGAPARPASDPDAITGRGVPQLPRQAVPVPPPAVQLLRRVTRPGTAGAGRATCATRRSSSTWPSRPTRPATSSR